MIALAIKRWRGRDPQAAKDRAGARKRLRTGTQLLADGNTVTLVGVVCGPQDTLTAPLSGDSCIAHRARADAWRSEGGRRTAYLGEVVRTACTPFVLESEQGALLVTADVAVIMLPTAPLVPRDVRRELAFIADSDHDANDIVVGADFQQCIVVDGDRIAVSGVVTMTREAAPGREYGYRDEPLVARITGHERWPLTLGPPRR